MTAPKPSKRKPRITREQAIEQAVRNVVSDRGDLRHLEATLGIAPWARHGGFTFHCVAATRAEFARLTQ